MLFLQKYCRDRLELADAYLVFNSPILCISTVIMSCFKLRQRSNKMMTRFLLLIINIYQKLISPLIPARCRYYPTCSQYGHTALRWHGAWRGFLLTCTRIGRCHPWGGSGIDFVPLPLYRYRYHYLSKNNYQQLTVAQGVYVDKFSYVAHLNYQLKVL